MLMALLYDIDILGYNPNWFFIFIIQDGFLKIF